MLKSLSTLAGIAADDGCRQVMLLECTGRLPLRQNPIRPKKYGSCEPGSLGLDCRPSDVFQAIPAEVFHFKKFVDPQVGSFSPETALLYATEGGYLIGYQPTVNPHHA